MTLWHKDDDSAILAGRAKLADAIGAEVGMKDVLGLRSWRWTDREIDASQLRQKREMGDFSDIYTTTSLAIALQLIFIILLG